MIAKLKLSAALASVLTLAAGGAQAAPQVLGIVASNGPVPLACDDGGCHVDLSSFCLQQPRQNPPPGQAYLPLEGADIVLVGRNAAGDMVRVPAAPYLDFRSDRGFTAIEATLSPDKLAALGLQDLAIEIGENVSLLPAEAVGDRDPQTKDEIALATGAVRTKGAEFFDNTGESGDAIRLANRMINALPAHGHSVSDADGHVLEAAIATSAGQAADSKGIELARGMYATCQQKVDVTHHIENMRVCLEGTHDRLVVNTNIDFWNSLGSY
jgi:hypothetical protein